MASFKSLLNPKHTVYGFRTGALLDELNEFYENRAQIRYELRKLRVRGLAERLQGKQSYRLTESGFRMLWVQLSSKLHFIDPVITRTYRKEAEQILSQPSRFEEAYDLLDRGLALIAEELSLKKAA